ncbi:MAG TPA: primosomal protein N', partial [Vitreoscilla sp.]|nr:primosomal protein N' [Vitreoscilla sp.]
MFWHQLALNVPLERLFTYSHPEVLPLGTRVVVTFRNKRHVAVVWAHTDELDFDASKVLPILEVLLDTPPLSEDWRAMMAFCSRYYLYPIGATVFTA